MKGLERDRIAGLFYKILKEEEKIESLIEAIKISDLDSSIKNSYRAFCCAILAKNSANHLQKGKYIKQYGLFIAKAFELDANLIEGRLIRLIIEQKLENVKFINHTSEDLKFLKENYSSVDDEKLREIILNLIK